MPGKYGIRAIPPSGQTWVQTSTIEGTPGIDTWVKSNEPKFLVEFGPPFRHIFIGFTQQRPLSLPPDPNVATVIGRIVQAHTSRPPVLTINNGQPVGGAWVGINTIGAVPECVYAGPCDPEAGTFSIANVPPGTYQIVTWDLNLDTIFAFRTVIVPPAGGVVDMGDIAVNLWFGTLEGKVFYDTDRDGFMDPNEVGISDQAINLRFRDGSIYQQTATIPTGEYALEEVFPFFWFIITEVDFARFFSTGQTIVVDNGGAIPADAGWDMPSEGKRNPQPQVDANGVPIINPNTGNNLSRTETGTFGSEVLVDMMQLMADQNIRVDWGKVAYVPGENGGITGIVYYDTTRAESDPRFNAAEPWQPGIPRVQVALYADFNNDGVIDDANGDGQVVLADIDNYPFGWADGGAKGAEDVKRNGTGVIFSPGDALNIAQTDSWDDSLPEGCIKDPFFVHGQQVMDCSEGLRTWNQIRPGVFDGGYAFSSYFPGGMASDSNEVSPIAAGTYIVEAAPPPGYQIVKEEDKNIDFGSEFTPSPLLLPPVPVGDLHRVPPQLSLFPGVPCQFAGQMRPLADRKLVELSDGENAAADFFMFTFVPKAARAVGRLTSDLTNVFNPNSPNFGEKFSPPWLPIAFLDYQGNQITRIYSDEWGSYNALLPSTATMNPPIPTGVSPSMITVALNHPGPIPDPANSSVMISDPFFNPKFSHTQYNLDFWPAKTTYLDTPVIPIAAFTGESDFPLDCEFADKTPVLYSVSGPLGGPYVTSVPATITITAVGPRTVLNPDYNSVDPNSSRTIVRDYGFGATKGTVTVGGTNITALTWAADGRTITAQLPAGLTSGQLMVTRGDSKKTTVMGVTLHVAPTSVVKVAAGGSIQAAIDAGTTVSGSLVLVPPGVYSEDLFMYKKIKLQGWGAGSTTINASHFPAQKMVAWRNKLASLIDAGKISLLAGQDPAFAAEEGPGILVAGTTTEFDANSPARIDGFTIMSADLGGAIFVNAYGRYLQITNNKFINNASTYGGGIRIGHSDLINGDGDGYLDADNDHIAIKYNHITQNGSTNAAGGISIFTGSDFYEIKNNAICGNLSLRKGGAIGHYGLSDQGVIANNTIIFNEAFYGTEIGGAGGGIVISGLPTPGGAPLGTLTEGAGNVLINANRIQGNLAGSGDGGAILTFLVNGQDVAASPADPNNWYTLKIFNNFITNNVAALAGAVTFEDSVRVFMINNTVANNDGIGAAAAAFPAGTLANSSPQPGGIVGKVNSADLAALSGQEFSSPVLQDNLIWHNRSFYWDITLNNNTGGLVPRAGNPYWNLAVVGTATPQELNPQNCYMDPNADPNFISEYFNELQTAIAPDEGGNFIDINFRPLTLTGNYHVAWDSPVTEIGGGVYLGQFAELSLDVDGQGRPFLNGPDIGADEAPGVFADNDSVSTPYKKAIAIDVLANDIDYIGGIIDPTTVTVIDEPNNGTYSINPVTGVITYTPNPTFIGTDTFIYTVRDNLGITSNPGTASVRVHDVITVGRAIYGTSTKRWDIRGKALVPGPGNTITLHVGSTLGGPVIGTAVVSASGTWAYTVRNSAVIPDGTKRVSIESSKDGQLANVVLTVRPR